MPRIRTTGMRNRFATPWRPAVGLVPRRQRAAKSYPMRPGKASARPSTPCDGARKRQQKKFLPIDPSSFRVYSYLQMAAVSVMRGTGQGNVSVSRRNGRWHAIRKSLLTSRTDQPPRAHRASYPDARLSSRRSNCSVRNKRRLCGGVSFSLLLTFARRLLCVLPWVWANKAERSV